MFVAPAGAPPLPPRTRGEKIAIIITFASSLALSIMVYGIATSLAVTLFLNGIIPSICITVICLFTGGTLIFLTGGAIAGVSGEINSRRKARAALMAPPQGNAP